jgi:hypothetical protein
MPALSAAEQDSVETGVEKAYVMTCCNSTSITMVWEEPSRSESRFPVRDPLCRCAALARPLKKCCKQTA